MEHGSRQVRARLLPVLLWVVLTFPALAQDRTFVSILGISGGSQDFQHLGWIDAFALDTNVTRPFSGPGANPATFADVAFLKGTDQATPLLHVAVADGQIFGSATIEVCRMLGEQQQCYYRIELTEPIVSAVDLKGSACVGPGACTPSQTESVQLRYSTIHWFYTMWVNGQPGGVIDRCWDLVSQTPCAK